MRFRTETFFLNNHFFFSKPNRMKFSYFEKEYSILTYTQLNYRLTILVRARIFGPIINENTLRNLWYFTVSADKKKEVKSFKVFCEINNFNEQRDNCGSPVFDGPQKMSTHSTSAPGLIFSRFFEKLTIALKK